MAKIQTQFDRCAYCDASLEGEDASLHDPYCPHGKALALLRAVNKFLRECEQKENDVEKQGLDPRRLYRAGDCTECGSDNTALLADRVTGECQSCGAQYDRASDRRGQ